MLAVLKYAIPLIKEFEGFSDTPYLCTAGKPTIGWGFTYYPNGVLVSLRDKPMSRAEADVILQLYLRDKYLPAATRLCPGLPAKKLAAIVSFVYNVGKGNLWSSTLRKYILAGEWDKVPRELRKWINSGGKPTKGLLRRRNSEITLWEDES